ncbi:ComEA family DNA-binding protein [Vibrio parahaemolyticus]|uniref:ComEA family DNA-binding protein n=1 Tax=Vibrio parahaemolyticus TaxID=670 RepID=UPI00387A9961
MKWILTLCLVVFAPLSLAADTKADTKADKYEGIEITVNINTASAEEIATMLKGIGEKKAQSIVDYRTEHGPFKTAADLTNVKGIGEATIKKNEDRILL